jgi:hypothetical protein
MPEGESVLENIIPLSEIKDKKAEAAIEVATAAVDVAEAAAGIPPVVPLPDLHTAAIVAPPPADARRLAEVRQALSAQPNTLQEIGKEAAIHAIPSESESEEKKAA